LGVEGGERMGETGGRGEGEWNVMCIKRIGREEEDIRESEGVRGGGGGEGGRNGRRGV